MRHTSVFVTFMVVFLTLAAFFASSRPTGVQTTFASMEEPLGSIYQRLEGVRNGIKCVIERAAIREELEINTDDMRILSNGDGVFVVATVKGFENFIAPGDFEFGRAIHVLYITTKDLTPDLPQGFYTVWVYIDPDAYRDGDTEAARIVLVNQEGIEFERQGTIVVLPPDDPQVQQGPRLTLIDDGGVVKNVVYAKDVNGKLLCLPIDIVGGDS